MTSQVLIGECHFKRDQKNNVRDVWSDVWSGVKKITASKQKEDQIHGILDRVDELNTVFNRFSSGTN